MDETPDPATTPVEPPVQGSTESSPNANRYDGWAGRATVMSRSRVAALVAGVVLGAVITGGAAAAMSEFGGEHHREGGESGAYQEGHDGRADEAAPPDGQDTLDPRDGGDRDGQDQIAPPRPPAPPAGSVPPAPVPAPSN